MLKKWIGFAIIAGINFLPSLAFGAVEISDGSVVGLYHFEGDSVDSSGNGANGTDTGMTYPMTAKVGSYSARFNGNTYPNNNASIAVALAGIGNNFTINWWMMASSSSSGDFGLISSGSWSGTGDLAINNDNNSSPDDKIGGVVYNNSVDTQSNSAYWTTNSVNTNSWNMITFISDGNNQKWRVLVNGVEDKNITVATLQSWATENDTRIGTFKVGANYRGYNGYIDEMVIANAVLSTSTISALYNSGSGDSVCTTVGCAPSGGGGSSTSTISDRYILPSNNLAVPLIALGAMISLGIYITKK